jgi:hypothetical protein
MGDRWHTTRAPVTRVSERRTWRLAVVVAVLIAVAGISTSVQARTAADPSVGVVGTEAGPQLTGLAASVLTGRALCGAPTDASISRMSLC